MFSKLIIRYLQNLQSNNQNTISVKSEQRCGVSGEPMWTHMDPCECHATMHLWIRQLECECKFAYNYNSRHAYKDKKPPNWPGKRKGALGAWAYKKAKNRFQIRAAKFLGLPIGNYTIFLSVRFYVKSILGIRDHCM